MNTFTILIFYLESSWHMRNMNIAIPTATIQRLRSNQDFFSGSFSFWLLFSIFVRNKKFDYDVYYRCKN